MRGLILGVVLVLAPGVSPAGDPPPEPRQKPLAGWFFPLPDVVMFHPFFEEPVLDKDKKDTIYRQSIRYDWIANAFRQFTVTVARDPAFKAKYSQESFKKDNPAWKEITVGKRKAWLQSVATDGPKGATTLVVPLGEDKAMILESGGTVGEAEFTAYAGKVDFEAVAAALAKPPRTDFRPTRETFAVLKKGMSVYALRGWLGDASAYRKTDEKAVQEYKLRDGSRVLLGFVTLDDLQSVTLEKDGKTEDLLEK